MRGYGVRRILHIDGSAPGDDVGVEQGEGIKKNFSKFDRFGRQFGLAHTAVFEEAGEELLHLVRGLANPEKHRLAFRVKLAAVILEGDGGKILDAAEGSPEIVRGGMSERLQVGICLAELRGALLEQALEFVTAAGEDFLGVFALGDIHYDD